MDAQADQIWAVGSDLREFHGGACVAMRPDSPAVARPGRIGRHRLSPGGLRRGALE